MTRAKLTQKALGQALGLSQPRVARLKRAGMPVHSVAAAEAWRSSHLDPKLVEARRCEHHPPAQRVAPGPAALDAMAADLLWSARPRLLGAVLADFPEHDIRADRGVAKVVYSILAGTLARLLDEAAGEGAESAVWGLTGAIPDDDWIAADQYADRLREEWREADQ